MTFLRLRKMPEDAEGENHRGDEQVVAEPDHHHTPSPLRTLTTVTASLVGR